MFIIPHVQETKVMKNIPQNLKKTVQNNNFKHYLLLSFTAIVTTT